VRTCGLRPAGGEESCPPKRRGREPPLADCTRTAEAAHHPASRSVGGASPITALGSLGLPGGGIGSPGGARVYLKCEVRVTRRRVSQRKGRNRASRPARGGGVAGKVRSQPWRREAELDGRQPLKQGGQGTSRSASSDGGQGSSERAGAAAGRA
jgi:hypothetical protein